MEFGITLAPRSQGYRYADEAVACLLDYVFGQLGKHRVTAQVDVLNRAAIGLCRRMGFRQEAVNDVGIVSAYTGGLANEVIPLELIGGQPAFNTGSSEDDTLISNGSVNDGNNHLVVVTRNQLAGQKIIYIDGVLDQYGFGTTNLLTDARLLTIASMADATDPNAADADYYNDYAGILDDLQIYSGVLSSNEVAQLHANPESTIPDISVARTTPAFNAALDTTNLPWATSGDSDWFAETNITCGTDVAAAESGSVTNSQSSALKPTAVAPECSTAWMNRTCKGSCSIRTR